jgi:hypothetical protein
VGSKREGAPILLARIIDIVFSMFSSQEEGGESFPFGSWLASLDRQFSHDSPTSRAAYHRTPRNAVCRETCCAYLKRLVPFIFVASVQVVFFFFASRVMLFHIFVL